MRIYVDLRVLQTPNAIFGERSLVYEKKFSIFMAICILMSSYLTFSSSVVVLASSPSYEDIYENYYDMILENLIEADGKYDPSAYQLVSLPTNNINPMSYSESSEQLPNAIQVVSTTENDVTIDTYLVLSKNENGEVVNALTSVPVHDESISQDYNFDGSYVRCTAKFIHQTYRGNNFLFPTQLEVTWLMGFQINDLYAKFYTLGDLYNQNDLDNPVVYGYDYTLVIHEVNPSLNVTFIDTGYPEGRLIRITDYVQHGSFVSLVVDGVEMQMTVMGR